MNTTSRQAVEVLTREMADKFLTVLKGVMASSVGINEKVGRNTLVDSELYKTANATAPDIDVIQLCLNDYYGYIEWERPPRYKGWPPPVAIADFIHRKGIHFDGCTDNQTVYLISRSIWELGHKARDIITPTFDIIDDGEWGEQLFDAIMTDIDNEFDKGL